MKSKVKITVSEINKMKVISEELNGDLSIAEIPFSKRSDTELFMSREEMYINFTKGIKNNIPEYVEKLKNRSPFEKFYDQVTNFLSNGKSFTPNELKSFI